MTRGLTSTTTTATKMSQITSHYFLFATLALCSLACQVQLAQSYYLLPEASLASALNNGNDDNDSIIIIMKKPSISESNSDGSSTSLRDSLQNLAAELGDANSLNSLDGISSQHSSPSSSSSSVATHRKTPISASEHQKNIQNDKYGVLKEAIFTTNNHLGHKNPPKFGSEEVY